MRKWNLKIKAINIGRLKNLLKRRKLKQELTIQRIIGYINKVVELCQRILAHIEEILGRRSDLTEDFLRAYMAKIRNPVYFREITSIEFKNLKREQDDISQLLVLEGELEQNLLLLEFVEFELIGSSRISKWLRLPVREGSRLKQWIDFINLRYAKIPQNSLFLDTIDHRLNELIEDNGIIERIRMLIMRYLSSTKDTEKIEKEIKKLTKQKNVVEWLDSNRISKWKLKSKIEVSVLHVYLDYENRLLNESLKPELNRQSSSLLSIVNCINQLQEIETEPTIRELNALYKHLENLSFRINRLVRFSPKLKQDLEVYRQNLENMLEDITAAAHLVIHSDSIEHVAESRLQNSVFPNLWNELVQTRSVQDFINKLIAAIKEKSSEIESTITKIERRLDRREFLINAGLLGAAGIAAAAGALSIWQLIPKKEKRPPKSSNLVLTGISYEKAQKKFVVSYRILDPKPRRSYIVYFSVINTRLGTGWKFDPVEVNSGIGITINLLLKTIPTPDIYEVYFAAEPKDGTQKLMSSNSRLIKLKEEAKIRIDLRIGQLDYKTKNLPYDYVIYDPEKKYNLYNVSEFVISPKQTVHRFIGEREPYVGYITSTLIVPLIAGKYQIFLIANPKGISKIEIISNKINFEVEEKYTK